LRTGIVYWQRVHVELNNSKTYIFEHKLSKTMNKDQGIGVVLLLASITGVVLYFWLVFLSAWWQLIIRLTAFVAVGLVLFILGWIGYTLATTPPPKPIEEIEKEIEKETKEEAKEEAPPPPPSSS